MSKLRIGFSTDFNLVNEFVGIGSTTPTARLDVHGQILSNNTSGGSGVSTFTEYQGFVHSKQGIGNTVSIAQTTKGNLNSVSGELIISGEVTIGENTSVAPGRLDSLTVTSTFDLPRGGTNDRSRTPEKGSTRFNQDLGQLEFYTGTEWRTVGSYDGSGRGRGVFGGGGFPNPASIIDYINISSTGNAINFGNLSVSTRMLSVASSSTRALFGGGQTPADNTTNTIEYITIASEGNSIDFGDLTLNRRFPAGTSSSTRALFGGGVNVSGVTNIIDYVQISTIGNALDFGDLSLARRTQNGVCSSPTRAVFLGGSNPSVGLGYQNIIDYITIASTGNAVDFGDSLFSGGYRTGCSNSIRGLFGGGYINAGSINTIEYITISTTGNSVYFGDLLFRVFTSASSSSSTRGVFAGGSGDINNINYVSILTTGNAIDFGDLSFGRGSLSACSDSHGGLGGF